MELDPWQEEVIATKGNICLRSGRQVGKSTVIGLKAAKFALENPKKLIMVISKTERQAGLLFAKILMNIHELDKKQIKSGKDRPTKHIINLRNGAVIHCLPAGDTGFGIMGFTIDLLIADEAAFIPEEVWNSIIPALAVTRGAIWLLSTPFVKQGYYYDCFHDNTFTSFHTSSEDCPRKDEIFLEGKRKNLTKSQYAQMYLGEFVDEFKQFFSDELIKKCCTLPQNISNTISFSGGEYFLGVDIARMGEDDSTFEIVDRSNKQLLIHVKSEVTSKTLTTDTTRKIIELDKIYHFKRIFLDSGGVGAGVLDQLLEIDNIKRRVEGINNSQRSIDNEEGRRKIIKEDLYDNLLKLMERNMIKLLDDDEVKASLKGVQFEYNEVGRMIIHGKDDHIAEGVTKASWCAKDKSLNIFVRTF